LRIAGLSISEEDAMINRFSLALIAGVLLAGMTSAAFAKGPLGSTGLEEAFTDAVGACGPSSAIAGALGHSTDPEVQVELRDALITEAADDAARVAGSNKVHADCMQKFLEGRGYTQVEMDVLPHCVKRDWPGPLVSLGTCVQNRARMEEGLKKTEKHAM
jgi:hypothetical protein